MADSKGDNDAGEGAGSAKKKEPQRGTGPTASRQQKRREERLKLIEDQIADGSLTIRQMTPEERKANPPRPPKKRGKRS